MKTVSKVVLSGTSALFAVVLGLQAQSTTTSNNTTRSNQTLPSSPTTTSNNQTDSRYSSPSSTTSNSQRSNSSSLSSSTEESDRTNPSLERRDSSSSSLNDQSSRSATSNSPSTSASLNASTAESSSSLSSSTHVSAETNTKVTTLVKEIDAEGPVVVDRIATQFADFACNEQNARMLVEALHGGTSVTLTGEDGQTVTFEPNVQLNYGEAYLALALAAETLRANGVTECATPEQWRAVLVGGPLTTATSTTTTASASARSDFPGILVLHSQGQGWSQIAQTSNVEISQIVSTAHSSLNMESSNLASATGEMDSSDKQSSGEYDSSNGKAKGHDKDKKDKKDQKWQDSDTPPRASDRGEEKKSDRARENTPPRG